MKQVIFKQLQVMDFKGVTKHNIEFSPCVTVIYGANRTGKTSLLDALYWVLFGKSLFGDTRFGIVPIKKQSAVPCVELEISIDGDTHTLTRKLKAGGATDCMIDGVPTQVRAYEQWVENNIMPIERFKLFSNPLYFSGLNWQDQRQLFTSFFENPDKADVLAMMEREGVKPTEGFMALIGKMKPEDIQLRMKVAISDLDTQKGKDQAVCDHLTKEIAEAGSISVADLEAERKALSDEWDAKTKRAKAIENKFAKADKESLLLSAIQMESNEIQQKIRRFNMQKEMKVAEIKQLISSTERKIQAKADEWKQAQVKEVKATCPTCGQSFPADRVTAGEDAKKALLEGIEADGKTLKEQLESYRAALADAELENCKPLEILYADKMREFQAQQKIVIELENAKTREPKESISGLRERMDEIGKQIAEAGRVAEKTAERDELIKAIEKSAREIEINERVQKDAGQYILYAAQASVEAVNAMFTNVKIELFEYQKNGVIKPTFKLLYNGVDFGDTSGAERVLIGLEINEYLKSALGASVPTIIDCFGEYPSIEFSMLPKQSVVSIATKEPMKVEYK